MKYSMLAALAATALLAACGEEEPVTAKEEQMRRAAAAAETVNFTQNAEIDNIKRRLEITSDPGAIGFVTLLNNAGQPIAYYSVEGKITSSGKRLTPPQSVYDYCDNRITPLTQKNVGTTCKEILSTAPSDEGTWGSSSPYVYFWTTEGRYVQWSGQYLYSDQPYRLSVEPLVISVE